MSHPERKVVVGVTGGIACYKIPGLVRLLRKSEIEVQVIMTDAATNFITPLTLETVSNSPVLTELFPPRQYVATRHIDIAEWPDLFVIAPATANFLGKIANGISDDLLTTTICATARPVLIAPAMNPQMWRNPITQRNYHSLVEFGYHFIEPTEGEMACDHFGVGRMPEPEQLFSAVTALLESSAKKKELTGKRILITAGPCREPLDPVRFISNRSSGKMGYALAQAASDLGADTTLISGPTSLRPPPGVKFILIETTQQMFSAVNEQVPHADCLIMSAAPADFTSKEPSVHKIKRADGPLTLTLQPAIDILKEVGHAKRPGQLFIGFALETDNGVEHARRKLIEKNLDLIVLNDPTEAGAGFDHDTNRVTILTADNPPEQWPLLSKRELSFRLLARLASLSSPLQPASGRRS